MVFSFRVLFSLGAIVAAELKGEYNKEDFRERGRQIKADINANTNIHNFD